VGVSDNDWIEVVNCNGVVVVCVIVLYCMFEGMVYMYYVQDCFIDVLILEMFGKWGGIYNLLMWLFIKFSYFIGGYV